MARRWNPDRIRVVLGADGAWKNAQYPNIERSDLYCQSFRGSCIQRLRRETIIKEMRELSTVERSFRSSIRTWIDIYICMRISGMQ